MLLASAPWLVEGKGVHVQPQKAEGVTLTDRNALRLRVSFFFFCLIAAGRIFAVYGGPSAEGRCLQLARHKLSCLSGAV